MCGSRTLQALLVFAASASLSGCVVHDGGEPGKEPIWWPAFLIRQAPDPLRPSNPAPAAIRTAGSPDRAADSYAAAATAPATRPTAPAPPTRPAPQDGPLPNGR